MIYIVSIIFYLLEIFMLCYLIMMIIKKRKITLKDTIIYPFVFLIAFFISFSGYLFTSDLGVLDVIPKGITNALNIIKLSIDTNLISDLKETNIGGLFLIGSYYGIYFVSLLSLVSLSILLFITYTKNFFRLICRWLRKEIVIIYGLSSDGTTFIKNLNDKKKYAVVILDSSSNKKNTDDKLFLDNEKVAFLSRSYLGEKKFKFFKWLIRNNKVNANVATFLENEEMNYLFVKDARSYIESNKKSVNFAISSSKEQQPFLENLVKNLKIDDDNNSSIHIYNKYDLISYDFICKHNFAKYIDQNLINDDCTIKDCDINLYVFGYGKVNQAILRDVLINTSFVTKEKVEGGYILKPKRLNVTVYEKKNKNDNLDLSLGFMKYNANNYHKDDYLELIDNFLTIDNFKFGKPVEDFRIVDQIYDDLKARGNRKQINFFIISMESSVFNWSIANKIEANLKQLPNSESTFFFRSKDNISYLNNNRIISFGLENSSKDSVLSYDNVIKDKIYDQARKAHYVYSHPGVDISKVSNKELLASFKWVNGVKRLSNLYAVANVYFKLSLMKLNDYKKDFLSSYDVNSSVYEIDKFIKPKEKYSKKEVLAFLEHERWNAFEIGYGILPLKVSRCMELTKNNNAFTSQVESIYHLCITTAKGLVDYYNLANELGYPDSADVIKYDDDVMDSIYENIDSIDFYVDKL